ncbi:hypothetical protein OSTOST_22739 [Ostertagia ostertagi]
MRSARPYVCNKNIAGVPKSVARYRVNAMAEAGGAEYEKTVASERESFVLVPLPNEQISLDSQDGMGDY